MNEKNSSSNRTFTKSSNETTNQSASSCHSSEDKMRSTDFPHNSNKVNEAKDRNSNSLILNFKGKLNALVTDANSKCVPFQQSEVSSNVENSSANNRTEVTENYVTNSSLVKEIIINSEGVVNVNSDTDGINQCDEGKDHIDVNKIIKDTSVSGTIDFEGNVIQNEDQSHMMNVPENGNYKNKIVTKSTAEEESESIIKVKNRNQRNSNIDLSYSSENESETNQALKDSNIPKDKSKVEFSDEIYVHPNEDLKPNGKLSLTQYSTDEIKSEFDKEESLKLEDSKQETNLLIKSADQLSSKIQVSPIEEDTETNSSVSTPESLTSANAPDSEMHAFAVQGGTEQMSEGHHLTSPDSSTSPLVSEEQGLMSPESFCPQVNEHTSQTAGMNLIPVNENGNVQNSVVISPEVNNKEKDFEKQKENPNKHGTELISNLTPLLNSEVDSHGNSESVLVIKQENIHDNSDLKLKFLNNETGLQRNSDSVTPLVESDVLSVIKQADGKDSNTILVKNEYTEMENKTGNMSHEVHPNNRPYVQRNTSETRSLIASDALNGSCSTAFTCNDTNKFLENKDLLDTNDGGQIMESDCSKFQDVVCLKVKSKDSDILQADDCVVEKKLTAYSKNLSVALNTGFKPLSLPVIQDSVVNMPNTVTGIDGEPTMTALETTVRDHQMSAKQSCSDKADLENYENELKLSSADKNFHLQELALEGGVSIKSTDVVKDEVCDNMFSAPPDSISLSGPSKTALSKMMCGNSTQQVDNIDESNTSKLLTGTSACQDFVGQAAAVVEYYVSVMEEDSHAMMSRLLQQVCSVYISW